MPDGLQQIVNWMMAKDPNGRYPTPDRAAQALQVFLAAGAEPLHAPESDPQMRSYLHLAPGGRQQEPGAGRLRPYGPRTRHCRRPRRRRPAPPPPPGVPTGKPPKLPQPPGRPARPTRTDPLRPSGTTRRSTVPSTRCRPCRPAGATVRASPVINVELVPLPAPGKPAPPKLFGPPFSRRDFLTFGVGAGAGALVTFLGLLIALSGKRSPPPQNPPPAPAEGKDKEAASAPPSVAHGK